jgi:hypothetical protein
VSPWQLRAIMLPRSWIKRRLELSAECRHFRARYGCPDATQRRMFLQVPA